MLLLDGFDELTADGQSDVTECLKLLLQAYPKIRIVTTGAPEHLDGLLALRFVPLAVVGWNKQRQAQFIQRWGELWKHFVAVEAWAQRQLEPVDPFLLNAWISADNQCLTPLELTLKVWAAYAGDLLGPHVLEAIASHVRRLTPTNTPLAALETLAMQVMLTAQPVFDPRKARAWVKAFELPEEASDRGEEAETQPMMPARTHKRKANLRPKRRRTKSEPGICPLLLPACSAGWPPQVW